jgi:hypothetical protein
MFGPCGFCNVRFEFKFHLPNDSTLDFEKKRRKSLEKKRKGKEMVNLLYSSYSY